MAGRLDLPDDAQGVLPSQIIAKAIEAGIITAGDYRIPEENVQPASLDLRLGEVAYRLRCSFLPDTQPVERKMKDYVIDEIDLRREGAVLETERPYLIPLVEDLALPPGVRGKANPKSSTGRLDVFCRVITDHSYRFDEITPGYSGGLYLEVVPLSFTIKVRQGLALNQLRLAVGASRLDDDELRALHETDPVLFQGGQPVGDEAFATADGLFLGLDLHGDDTGKVGYRAQDFAPLLDMSRFEAYEPGEFWEPVFREQHDRLVLAPEKFYLLLSNESVRIPPAFAAEMTAYDPTSGELRTHYAGFFDPGFGHDPGGAFAGTRAALEVRAHDVPFIVEHRQRVCKITFERMVAPSDVLYGEGIGSSYQRQVETLSKHFRHPEPVPDPVGGLAEDASQDDLLSTVEKPD